MQLCVKEDLRTAVVCRAPLFREMLTECLVQSGIEVAMAVDEVAALPPEIEADILVVVDSGVTGDDGSAGDRVAVSTLQIDRCVFLSEGEASDLLHSLKEQCRNISELPLEIAKSSVPHALHLAAQQKSICIDQMCRRRVNSHRRKLLSLGLLKEDWEVLSLLAAGCSNKEIARKFDRDEGYVKTAIRRILVKLGVDNRTQAAVVAAKAGL